MGKIDSREKQFYVVRYLDSGGKLYTLTSHRRLKAARLSADTFLGFGFGRITLVEVIEKVVVDNG